MLFERLSNSSSEMHPYIGEDDLAKDMGIFGFEISGKQQEKHVNSPKLERRGSLEEIDATEPKKSTFAGIFMKNQKKIDSSSLKGIFNKS